MPVTESEGTQRHRLTTKPLLSATVASACFLPVPLGHTCCPIFSCYLTVSWVAVLCSPARLSVQALVSSWEQRAPPFDHPDTEAPIHLKCKGHQRGSSKKPNYPDYKQADLIVRKVFMSHGKPSATPETSFLSFLLISMRAVSSRGSEQGYQDLSPGT